MTWGKWLAFAALFTLTACATPEGVTPVPLADCVTEVTESEPTRPVPLGAVAALEVLNVVPEAKLA